MLSERSAEIARALIRENLRCQELVLNCSDHMAPSPIADELRELAEIYLANATDLRQLLESLRVDTDDATAERHHETKQLGAVLQPVLQAASRLRRRYASSVSATRELSERLPRQFARSEVAYSRLKWLRKQSDAAP